MADGKKHPPLMAIDAPHAALSRDLGVGSITVPSDRVRCNFAVPEGGEWFVQAPRGPTLEEVHAGTFCMANELRLCHYLATWIAQCRVIPEARVKP